MSDQDRNHKPSVAVVGGGVAGLTAAHLLATSHEVTLFEADDRLGGHAHTHTLAAPGGGETAVDSGFIVHNERTYPQLLRLFAELDVKTQPTEMSMSITCDSCGVSYAGGRGIGGVLAQPRRVADPRFMRMLIEVPRFHRRARALLASDQPTATWGEFLASGGYSDYFIGHFAIPLVSCVWSSDSVDARAYPAAHLCRFLDHHGMLSVKGSPVWRTVVGGSRVYVDGIRRRLHARGATVLCSAGVTEVSRTPDGVRVRHGETVERYDRVVLAVHADQALRILSDADDQERGDLAAIAYSRNTTVLHSDQSILPTDRRARAAWNLRVDCAAQTGDAPVRVDYWMNRLMGIADGRDYVVSLNPDRAIASDARIAEMNYSHPIFTVEAVAAAARLRDSGGASLAYAGAHLGWGFHEDGCRSGVAAAQKFGAGW